MTVYQCEDTMESIFTAIYNAYEEKRDHRDTRISFTGELLLFAEYVKVSTEEEKAGKVIRTLKRRFGEGDYLQLCYALASESEEKAQAVYQTIVDGLDRRPGPGHLFDNLVNNDVNKTFYLARGVSNETHRLHQFVRFQQLENGVLFSKIGPKNNVMTFILPHFTDRFPMENFMIYDENRKLFGIHPAGKEWYLVHGKELLKEGYSFQLSGEELHYQELFKYFCHKIAIKERRNVSLQRNMLPLRYQEYMTEFDKKCQNGKIEI